MPMMFTGRGPMPLPAGGGNPPTGAVFDGATKSTHITLSNFNLTATAGAGSGSGTNALSTTNAALGGAAKYYTETTIIGTPGGGGVGLFDSTWPVDTSAFMGDGSGKSCGVFNDGHFYKDNADSAVIGSFTTGDVISMAVDFSHNAVWFAKNGGTWNAAGTPGDPATNTNGLALPAAMVSPIRFGIEIETSGNAVTTNFNASGSAFAYPGLVPSGFTGWA